MASVGDEKKIQALFSELRFADEQTAPSFAAAWHRAHSRSLKPRRAFNLSFAVATALLICTLASLVVWSMYSRPAATATAYATLSPTSDSFAPRAEKSPIVALGFEPTKIVHPPIKKRVTKTVSQRHVLEVAALRQLTNKAKALENWQSPTADLLSSPSDGLFKSLPQLNENANELKSFLPNRENEKEK
jgi:hypothetical protein